MFYRTAVWFAASFCVCLLGAQQAAVAAEESAAAEGAQASASAAETYFLSKTVDYSFDEAKTKVTELLAAEKFAVLWEIDMQAKVKEKLQIDMPRYLILGACNSKLAYSMWLDEPNIGALLPCNCVLRELPDGKTELSFKDPLGLLDLTGNPAIADELESARAIVEKVLAAL